ALGDDEAVHEGDGLFAALGLQRRAALGGSAGGHGIAPSQLLHSCAVTALMYTHFSMVSRGNERTGGTAADEETGRFRQRRRARAAIVAAAGDLLRAGRTPSINDVADAADVSRRTVYLYFPTVDQLLLDATLGILSQAAV